MIQPSTPKVLPETQPPGGGEAKCNPASTPGRLWAGWPALLCLGWMIVIYGLSTTAGGADHTQALLQQTLALAEPGTPLSPDVNVGALNTIVRKLAHFSEYGILMGLGFSASRACLRLPVKRALELVLLLTVYYAIADEFHQSFEWGRTSAVRDVLIDSAGASTVAVVLGLFVRSGLKS